MISAVDIVEGYCDIKTNSTGITHYLCHTTGGMMVGMMDEFQGDATAEVRYMGKFSTPGWETEMTPCST